MSDTGEATINPDGTTTTTTSTESTDPSEPTEPSEPKSGTTAGEDQTYTDQSSSTSDDQQQEIPDPNQPSHRKGTDPALYLAASFILFVVLYILHYKRQKKKQMDRESFFLDMDGDKFNIQLPKAVDEYYEVKDQCMDAGWEPGKVSYPSDYYKVYLACDYFIVYLFLILHLFTTSNYLCKKNIIVI